MLAVGAALLVAACAGPILARPVPSLPSVALPARVASSPPDPQPVVLPRDDSPHDRLTEWWYDTGHLVASDGRRFGFELVVFRAERGELPVGWASHLALTDEGGDRFLYDQRSQLGGAVDRSAPGGGFDLRIGNDLAPGSVDPSVAPWTMRGADGRDHVAAAGRATDGTPFGIDLALDARGLPPALHDRDGYVEFGQAGGSYYYSRTRMDATGTVTLGGEAIPVTGRAWFDHQWGDFIAVGGGGWDWFAVNLGGGDATNPGGGDAINPGGGDADATTDITLSLVRDADGTYPLVYGTLVDPDGAVTHLPAEAFEVVVTARWTSPASGADYPAGWRISIPGESLVIELAPTVADQELDTRATTGVVYWEGSQRVSATRAGAPLTGEAYVELTGYAPCSC
jgi:predicted secreted hydrolase